MRIGFILSALAFMISCGATKLASNTTDSTEYFILHPSIRIVDFDAIGYLYILDANDQLSKFDTSGHLLYQVVNNNLGQVHSIDAGNPFKTMMFYRDQQTIVLYDKTLSEIQRIHLVDWGLNDVTAVCLSPNNSIWLFDGMNKVLMRMSEKGDPVFTSDPFDIIRPGAVRPNFIGDADHFLVLGETSHPVSVFDDFGNYLYSEDLAPNGLFSVSRNMVITNTNSSISRYDISEHRMLEPIFIQENIEEKRVYLSRNKVFVTDDKGIYIMTP